MILEKQKEAMIHQVGESTESIGMSLDLDSAQILMQMLSKNLYSDDIGSTIRECASNALDSHRRAGVNDPIIVSLQPTKDNTFEFSVEDFGIGLDDQDVKNIISKYGKSTKRDSANELGMMGLGFKAPLAYCSSFYFVARKNGMERKYMMYEGEDVNTIDLLYEAPTDQRNGVKVIIPVKWQDKYAFVEKIREQLAYFESVYFNVLDSSVIDNSFTIERFEHFQWSSIAKSDSLHLSLDNVYYPIDFAKLGIDPLIFPVALRFSLTDGIFPTPNREAIRYTQEAKAIILKKISLVADSLVEKYNKTITDSEDACAVIDYYTSRERMLQMSKSKYDIMKFAAYASVQFTKPKLKGAENLDLVRIAKLKDNILGEYRKKFSFSNRKFYSETSKWNDVYYGDIKSPYNRRLYYVYSDKLSQLMKDYLRTTINNGYNGAVFVKKEAPFKLGKLKNAGNGAYDNYINILQLDKKPKSDWRKLIQEFQYVVDSITKSFINVDEIEIPQSFIDNRKKQRVQTMVQNGKTAKRRKISGEIVCKQAEPLERWVEGKNCKWVSTNYDMANFHKNKFILVYGKQQDADAMDKWFKATRGHNIEFAILSERELKIVTPLELHNLMPFSKFMEGKNKPFQRIATACLIDKLRDENRSVFINHHHLKSISSDLHNKVSALREYHATHFRDVLSDELRNAIIDQALEHNTVDQETYVIYKQVKEICEKLVFMDAVLDKMSHYDSDSNRKLVQVIVDLFKYHKHRIDWKNYNITFNEDVVETPVDDQILEEIL